MIQNQSMQESKQIIKPREDWSFDKRGQFLLNLLIGASVFAVVPLNFAPYPETLLLIERSWLVVYSIMHGLAFAVSLEVFGSTKSMPLPENLTIFFLSCSPLLSQQLF